MLGALVKLISPLQTSVVLKLTEPCTLQDMPVDICSTALTVVVLDMDCVVVVFENGFVALSTSIYCLEFMIVISDVHTDVLS